VAGDPGETGAGLNLDHSIFLLSPCTFNPVPCAFLSFLTLAVEAAGAEIVTVEKGL
jgi:hypothetical protein